MPVITVNDQQHALPPGQTRLGGGPAADVRVGDEAAGVQAVVDLAADGRAVIRRGTANAGVRVNGVVLGVEPTPLLHGDKVEIDGIELFFSDDSKGGATQFVAAGDIAALTQKRTGAARATAATGGRLVSLVDGKEYTIPSSGITIGRDATANVVVAEREVSRIHAEILPAENGYVIHDRSTNGLYVNGTRVQGSQLLSRADVIRAGTEEFRFYADVALASAKAAPAPTAPPPAPEPIPSAPVTPSVGHGAKLNDTTATPSTERPPAPPPARVAAEQPKAGPAPIAASAPLALIEIVAEGPAKGTIFEIRSPLTHIGRGPHNDIVLVDDSVSDSHAKIQRRDDGWYVVDVGSTNGTYLAGVRLTSERRLEGAPDLRFGGVKTIFRARDLAVPEASGTRAIASVKADRVAPSGATGTAPTPPQPVKKGGIPAWVWIAIVVVAAAVIVFLMRGHTS